MAGKTLRMSPIIAAAFIGVFGSIIALVVGTLLERRRTEHQIHYARLHERRAEIIEQLYKLVVEAQHAFPVWSYRGIPKDEDTGMEWIEAMGNLSRYYEDHSIWLEQDLGGELQCFLEEHTRLGEEMGELLKSEDLPNYAGHTKEELIKDPELREAHSKALRSALSNRQQMKEELDSLRDKLGDEFRKILWGKK